MAKQEIKQQILTLLLDASAAMTLAQLAERAKVSQKSIRNYLAEIEQEGILGNLMLKRRPGVGIFLEEDLVKRAELRRRLASDTHKTYALSPEGRQHYIVKTLFKNRYTYTIQLLADDLYVSKSTIVQDLVYVQEWLEKHQLRLERKPNRGLWIEGDEYVFRRAMRDFCSEAGNGEFAISEEEIEQLDYRIDFISFNKIKSIFPRLDIYKIQSILQQAEKKLDYALTDEAFINLIIHIAITLERIKQCKDVVMEEEKLRKLAANMEFQVAKWIVNRISEETGICIPKEEVGYISLHLLGARVQQNSNAANFAEILESQAEEYVELARRVIHAASEILEVDLSGDRLLLTGLTLHFRPSVMRLRYGMEIRNPLLERIKQEYTSIFGAAWAASTIFERYFGVTINEDEVGYIAMHLGGAMARLKNKIKAVVVCASGLGTSQLVAMRLEREVPELEITEIVSVQQLSKVLTEGCDIIISTVAVRERHEKLIHISTLVDEKDVFVIRNFLRSMQEQRRERTCQSLAASISADFCFAGCVHKSKKEVIKFYGEQLEKSGYTRAGFVESALQREQITSTSVGRGVAIPHGNDEFVLQPKICVVQLTKPIKWGDDYVDLVMLLALNVQYAKNSFFRSFYAMLDDEQVLRRMRHAKNGQEIMNIILEEG